jgi:hypothetical protein
LTAFLKPEEEVDGLNFSSTLSSAFCHQSLVSKTLLTLVQNSLSGKIFSSGFKTSLFCLSL